MLLQLNEFVKSKCVCSCNVCVCVCVLHEDILPATQSLSLDGNPHLLIPSV